MIKFFFSKIWAKNEDLGDPATAHAIVSAVNHRDGRSLFRVERDMNGYYLLLQSANRPAFEVLPGITFQTKAVDFTLQKRQYLFKVRANPVKINADGKRVALSNTEQRDKWFSQIFEANGFESVEVSSGSEGIQKFGRSERKIVAYSAIFDGVFRVKDPMKAEQIILRGVGKCKAFGFGLITLKPV